MQTNVWGRCNDYIKTSFSSTPDNIKSADNNKTENNNNMSKLKQRTFIKHITTRISVITNRLICGFKQ